MNVLHYRYSGTRPAPADCAAIANHLATATLGAYLTHIPASTALSSVIVTDLQGNDGQQGSAASTQAGTGGIPPEAASASFVLHLLVNARYRGGHPRVYFPPLGNSYLQDSQTWQAAAVTPVFSALDTWLNALPGFSAGGCVVGLQCAVSYYNKAVNPTPPHLRPSPLVLDITSRTPRPKIGSQRRRLG
jgi:hypothetical protein